MYGLRKTRSFINSINFEENKPLKEKCKYELISNPQKRIPRNRYSSTEIENQTLKLYFNSRSGHCLFNTESNRAAFLRR